MMIFIKLVYLSSVIKEENFKWHLEAFASELFTFARIHQAALPFNIAILCHVAYFLFFISLSRTP